MIYEFMEAGPISNLIQKCESGGKRFTENFCKYTLYKITKALDSMHTKNVLHRDFNSGNVHFDSDGSIKLTDMSRATNLTLETQFRSTRHVTKMVAPEILNKTQYAKSVDVWGLGCFAYELAFGSKPYEKTHRGEYERFQATISEDPVPFDDTAAVWSPEFQDFIKACLIKDANERATI